MACARRVFCKLCLFAVRSIRYLLTGGLILFLAGFLIYFRWSSAIRQPLEFSHSSHVKQGIQCSVCHSEQSSDQLPPGTSCTGCHKDRSFPVDVSWIRVYRVAPDIIFSHNAHASFPCAACHEQMTAGKRWIHETRFKMDSCTQCHEQKGAQNECRTCHKNR